MGYNTRYHLDYDGPFNEDIEKTMETLADGYNPFEEETKWYTHEKDMRMLSKQFPDNLFTLRGDGDDNEDMWKEFYLNGKMQREEAIITFLGFDPSKLR